MAAILCVWTTAFQYQLEDYSQRFCQVTSYGHKSDEGCGEQRMWSEILEHTTNHLMPSIKDKHYFWSDHVSICYCANSRLYAVLET